MIVPARNSWQLPEDLPWTKRSQLFPITSVLSRKSCWLLGQSPYSAAEDQAALLGQGGLITLWKEQSWGKVTQSMWARVRS